MMTSRALVSILGLVVAVGACSSEADEDVSSEAAQAIQAMEQADAEAVRDCESDATSCSSENANAEGEQACSHMKASCEDLEAQLAQVRERAVACWETVRECAGGHCKASASQCHALGDTVGEARGPVLECGQNVRQCMHQAASAPAEGSLELCGALRQACGSGVAEPSVIRVRIAEQEQTQAGDGESDTEGAPSGEQDGAGADSASGEQNAQGTAGNSATEASSGDGVSTQEQSAEVTATQARQRACLSEVQSCCDAATAPDADPLQLRQGGNACELQACAE